MPLLLHLTSDQPDATNGRGRDALTPAEALKGKSRLRAKRVSLEIPVQLRSRAGVVPGLVKNVCPGGLFVATARLLPVGDWVVVSVTIPGATEPVEILGEVRWSRPLQDLVDVPGGLGLRFVETPVRAAVLALELQRLRECSTRTDHPATIATLPGGKP